MLHPLGIMQVGANMMLQADAIATAAGLQQASAHVPLPEPDQMDDV